MLDGLALLPHVKVLVLDPDPGAVRDVGEQLGRLDEGVRVVGAQTLHAAENTLRTTHVGCVVTEARLPDGDGAAIVRRLWAVRPAVPVIVWTAGGSEELAAEMLKVGAADYLSNVRDVKYTSPLATIRLPHRHWFVGPSSSSVICLAVGGGVRSPYGLRPWAACRHLVDFGLLHLPVGDVVEIGHGRETRSVPCVG